MLRDNSGWLLAGLIATAVLLGASACGGESTEKASGGFIAFRQPTAAPTSPTQPTVGPIVSTRPCGAREWIKVKGVVICLPTGATFHTAIIECPPVPIVGTPQLPCPDERMFDGITRGDSEVWIGTESGKIVKWDVAPEDEEEFRSLILEPLQAAGY